MNLPAYPCCTNPSVKSMLPEPEVNTICLRCGRHWYGYESMVCVYTRREWDHEMEAV